MKQVDRDRTIKKKKKYSDRERKREGQSDRESESKRERVRERVRKRVRERERERARLLESNALLCNQMEKGLKITQRANAIRIFSSLSMNG
jgi:hypothetical protein